MSEMSKDSVTNVMDGALKEWAKQKYCGDMNTSIRVNEKSKEWTVDVRIGHRETFPLGGKSYDVYILGDKGQTLQRERVSVVYGTPHVH